MFFQIPLALQLSYQIEHSISYYNKSNEIGQSQDGKKGSLIKEVLFQGIGKLWENFFFVILMVHSLLSMLEYYQSYSIVAVMLCPFKTWNLIAACWFKYKCGRMKALDFEILMKRGRSIIVNEPNELNKDRLD